MIASVGAGAVSVGVRPDASTDRRSPVSFTPPPPANAIYFILLDATLTEQRIELLGFRNGEISFRDSAGQTRTVLLDEIVALLPAWWSPRGLSLDTGSGRLSQGPITKPLPAREGSGFIELTDGQRIGVGLITNLDGSALPSADAVLWETGGTNGTGGFGPVSVPLDAVRRIKFTPLQTATPGANGLSRLPRGLADVLARAYPTPSRTRTTIAPRPTAAKADQVMLVNGDALSGFIERIGPVVTIESNGSKVDTPVKQVAEIRLLNEARAPKGTRLWLSGGIVIDAAQLSADGPKTATARADAVRVDLSPEVWKRAGDSKPRETPSKITEADGGTLRPAPTASEADKKNPQVPSGHFSIPRILAIVPHVESLESLASRPVLRQHATEDRPSFEPVRYSWFGLPLGDEESAAMSAMRQENTAAPENPSSVQPPMGAADIELPGPMLVEWTIPASAMRIAGWAELPRECWTWGHCTVVMTLAPVGGATASAGTELFRETLSSEHPIAEFSIPIGATVQPAKDRVIRVEVLSGERGPIQDRVLLRRVLLLGKPGGK